MLIDKLAPVINARSPILKFMTDFNTAIFKKAMPGQLFRPLTSKLKTYNI